MAFDCTDCPLRKLDLFENMSTSELSFIKKFKTGEFDAAPGADILTQDTTSAQLFTVLSGMGIRSKSLEDGRRQVIGFVFPGDLIGLQSGVMEPMTYSVSATTEMKMCVFNRAEFWELVKSSPERAMDVVHICAHEENLLGESLTAVGQLDAIEKVAWALGRFFARLEALKLARNDTVPLPFRQQDLADALGLSLVHTNKTLAKLRSDGLADWRDGKLKIPDLDTLLKDVPLRARPRKGRPLI